MKGTHTYIVGILVCFGLSNTVIAETLYKVKNVAQGSSLPLKEYPSKKSRTVVALPHNASWLLRRDKGRKVVNKVVWRKVQWNKHQGWVSLYYLAIDPIASQQLEKRKACLKDKRVTKKLCCGYSFADRRRPYQHIPILKVKDIAVGKSLILQSNPWGGKKLVALPHDATWIADLGQRKKRLDGTVWAHVRWSGETGWLNMAKLSDDPEMTRIGDWKRKFCALPPINK